MKWMLVAVIILSTTLGDILKAYGMRRHGEIHDFRPAALRRVVSALVSNWYIIASVLAMAVSFFAFLALVSIAEISFAVPITAASYVLETVLARLVLKEQIEWRRWAGCSLVTCGVLLLSV